MHVVIRCEEAKLQRNGRTEVPNTNIILELLSDAR
jgi:hypothetical protein